MRALAGPRGEAFIGSFAAFAQTRAARLLLETAMSVAQVAAALDFPDEKNFARFFRREKGASPHKYRSSYKV